MELPLIFLAGMLGSSHCVGMCGGYATMLGLGSTNWRSMATAQSLYTLGRIFTYATLGFVSGAVGLRLMNWTAVGVNVLAILSVAAGILLIVQGLLTLGVRLWPRRAGTATPCLAASAFRSLLRGHGRLSQFLAGVLTGLLPCGLVYGFLSLAAATGDPLRGAIVMAVFGLGTAPLMVATGWGASLIGLLARQRLLKVAACCVVITGCVTLARGASNLQPVSDPAKAACPFCVGDPVAEAIDVL